MARRDLGDIMDYARDNGMNPVDAFDELERLDQIQRVHRPDIGLPPGGVSGSGGSVPAELAYWLMAGDRSFGSNR